MADVTMLEAAKHHHDEVEARVAKRIVESAPALEYLPMKTISGSAFRYHEERSLGTIAFRGVNGLWTPDSGVINPAYEGLVIMGGEVQLDNFEVLTQGNLIDLKVEKYRMKARALGIEFTENFFEGDTAVDPYAFDGIRKRITGGQLINAGTGGATLTLAMLDELLDAVVGDNGNKILFMNKTMRRKITSLARAQTGTVLISQTMGNFNRQFDTYAGAVIRVVEREDDGSTIFGFDEDDGSGNLDTTSIYCVRFGMEYVHGIQHSAIPQVKDFGEVSEGPYHKGRIEWYPGLVVRHPRAMARLENLNNA